VDSQFEASGLFRRAGAALIDTAILEAPLVALARGGSIPGWFGLVINALYATALVAWRGQTLGMMLVNIRVARISDGGTPAVNAALVHWGVFVGPALIPIDSSFITILSLAWTVFILASMVQDPLRRGIHDRAAGTIVVLTGSRSAAGQGL
jgi:uncharacterized RDD family membrane protein YckC